MKRLLATLLVLLLCIPALATDLQIQSQSVPDWHDTRTNSANPPHLRIFASDPFWTSAGIAVPAGSPNGGKFYKDITCSQSGTTVTIPTFALTATTDASAGTRASRFTFYWYTASGAQISTTPFLADAQVPPSIVSISGCTPIGTCATFADLALYNSPSPPLPTPTYPTTDQVSAMIIANLSLAAGAPSSATYITQTPNSILTNEQPLNALSTGLMKNTAGIVSTAVAETDFSSPLTFVSPILRSTNAISIQVATAGQNGYLASADWTTFNNKQAALGFTPENSANKNASGGYAGLSGGKLANAQMSEVLALGDLTDATDALGTGTTVPKGTFAGIASGQVPMWNGTNFVNGSPGTVLSVGFATNASWLTVTGSPVTGSGTLTANLTTGLTANQVLATPNGSTGTVTLRALVNNDLPIVDVTHGGTALNSLPAANHFLRVNAGGTAFEDTQFIQGANITISHASGSVTIAAAAAGTHNLLSATHPDTSPGTVVRGDLPVGQGAGTPTWQRLAIGAANRVFVSDGTDATWGQVSLTAGVTGILPAANGGTGFNGSTAANGTIPIGNGSGFTLATISAGSNISIVNTAGGIQIAASGTLGVAWHNLTDPVAANLSLAMGANTTTFTWGSATGGGVDTFTIRDSVSNTGTGHLFMVNTAASSAAKVVAFLAQGTSNGVEMGSTGILAPVGTGGITANALSGVAGNGVMVRTAALTFTNRTHADAAGITWTNGNGVSGDFSAVWNPTTFVSNVVLWDASQATRTLTANLSGATDPVWTYGNNSADLSTGVLKQGGTAVVIQSFTLTGGTGIAAIGDLSTNRTVSIDQSFSPTWTGIHTWTPTARTSGSASYLTINIPTDTGLTASTESIGIKTVTGTRTWAVGALTTQEENFFAAPTYAFAGSSTLTNAATVAISGGPIAGSNATLTHSWALWVKSGEVRFDSVVSQLTSGAVDPLSGPNLVGAQIVKMGTAASGTFSASGDYRQFQAYVINAGTANTVAGTFGVRMDGAGIGWGINPYSFANVSGSTAIATETNFGVLTSGGASYGNVMVVVGNFASNAFLQFQSGASGISAASGIIVLKGGAGLDPISGSFLSFSGGPSMNVGLDMSGGTFTGGSAAPILLGNNSFIKAKDSGGTARFAGGLGTDDFALFQSGGVTGGVRFLNSANTLNLFRVREGGALVGVWFAAAQITSNQNNYNPDAASGAAGKDAYLQRWFSDASRDITGLVFQQAAFDGQMHVIWNAGANNIVLKHESASSTAANRFLCSTFADITLSGGQAADLIYSSTNARWVVFKRN